MNDSNTEQVHCQWSRKREWKKMQTWRCGAYNSESQVNSTCDVCECSRRLEFKSHNTHMFLTRAVQKSARTLQMLSRGSSPPARTSNLLAPIDAWYGGRGDLMHETEIFCIVQYIKYSSRNRAFLFSWPHAVITESCSPDDQQRHEMQSHQR